jgi:hypothetical protein
MFRVHDTEPDERPHAGDHQNQRERDGGGRLRRGRPRGRQATNESQAGGYLAASGCGDSTDGDRASRGGVGTPQYALGPPDLRERPDVHRKVYRPEPSEQQRADGDRSRRRHAVPLEVRERSGRHAKRQQARGGPARRREELGGDEIRLRGDARRDEDDGQDERRGGRQVRDGFEATEGASSTESAVPRLNGRIIVCHENELVGEVGVEVVADFANDALHVRVVGLAAVLFALSGGGEDVLASRVSNHVRLSQEPLDDLKKRLRLPVAEYATEGQDATLRAVPMPTVIVPDRLDAVAGLGVRGVMAVDQRQVVFGVGEFVLDLELMPALRAEQRWVVVAPEDGAGNPRFAVDAVDVLVAAAVAFEQLVNARGFFVVVAGFAGVAGVAVEVELPGFAIENVRTRPERDAGAVAGHGFVERRKSSRDPRRSATPEELFSRSPSNGRVW